MRLQVKVLKSTSLAINMDASEQLFLNGNPITAKALRSEIQQAKQLKGEDGKPMDVVCLIGADHSVSHGKVVGIIDLVKQEGVSKFAINIEQKENNVLDGE